MCRTVYKTTPVRLLAAALLALLALAGCGNKGPLKMPPSSKPAATGEAPRTGGGAASASDTDTAPGAPR
ncbi:LPS translocon maturation chaperone LptM [Accumulibacter sp.]|uniref:LPS translocon maturation chaperone LptM n=1 Tax=Accumulibacter sp. TaxID=2053492 RepID=UPI0038FC934E